MKKTDHSKHYSLKREIWYLN